MGLGLGLLAGGLMMGGSNTHTRNQHRAQQRTVVVTQQQQQRAPCPPGHTLMTVVCPANVYGGQQLQISTASGPMKITVPQGVAPGTAFGVAVPQRQPQQRQQQRQHQVNIPQATYVQQRQQPQQATYVQQPAQVQQATYVQQQQQPQPQQQQQPQQQPDDASRLIPDMVRAMTRNHRDYLEIRNAVTQTIAPTPLSEAHKQLIRHTIATEQNAMRSTSTSTTPQTSSPSPLFAQVVAPTSPKPTELNSIARQLIVYGYSREISVAAGERCSTMDSAMDWISHQPQDNVVYATTSEEDSAAVLGRQGRRSFGDAMGMPSAPPLF